MIACCCLFIYYNGIFKPLRIYIIINIFMECCKLCLSNKSKKKKINNTNL